MVPRRRGPRSVVGGSASQQEGPEDEQDNSDRREREREHAPESQTPDLGVGELLESAESGFVEHCR